MKLGTLVHPSEWAAATFGQADLKDERHQRRLLYLASQVATNPAVSLPKQTQGRWADLKAAYRLLREADVTHRAVSEPSWQHTRRQANQEEEAVLLVHDDTQLDYGYAPAIEGLGPIGNGSHRGLLVHSVLAVVPQAQTERVVGLAYQEPWVRQPAPRQANGRKQTSKQRRHRARETAVWWRAVEEIGPPQPGQCWIHVGDRYGDMYLFMRACRQLGCHFLVRATHNRCLQAPEEPEPEALTHLLDEVKRWPAQGQREQEVPSEHERRARSARLKISWGQLQLPALDEQGRRLPNGEPLRLWAVHVWEPEPPLKQEGQREWVPCEKHGPNRRRRSSTQAAQEPGEPERVEALEWVLLTSLPVTSQQEAWRCVERYQARWSIEDFHRGLKTGCQIQQRHLRRETSLEALLGLLSPVAVRLLQLRTLIDDLPEQPVLDWVLPEEAQVVACRVQVPAEQLTVRSFLRAVAQLGGFLGRTSDGQPGWQSLWEGWQRVQWMVEGLQVAGALPRPP